MAIDSHSTNFTSLLAGSVCSQTKKFSRSKLDFKVLDLRHFYFEALEILVRFARIKEKLLNFVILFGP